MKNIFKTNINLPVNTKITKINQMICVKNVQSRVFLNLFPMSKDSGLLTCKKGNYNSTLFRLLQKAIIGVNLAFITRLFFCWGWVSCRINRKQCYQIKTRF